MTAITSGEDETMSDEKSAAEPSGASGGSTVNAGQELASRLMAWNDRLLYGNSFERVTRTRCGECNGTGYGNGMCWMCGGVGSLEHRERIDPKRVTIRKDGSVVVNDQ